MQMFYQKTFDFCFELSFKTKKITKRKMLLTYNNQFPATLQDWEWGQLRGQNVRLMIERLQFRVPQQRWELCGAGIAWLVEHQTEKPGAILIWVRIPSVKGIFLPEPTSNALSYSVHIAPMCNHCINMCVHVIVKNHKRWQSVWTHENITHTNKETRFPTMD